MESVSEITELLEEAKKSQIIEIYLREKYKEHFDPVWLNATENYEKLAAAINFFYELNHDKLNVDVIGSENVETRKVYIDQYELLERLLDKVVVFSGVNPPVATAFKEKEAILLGLYLNQEIESRSLRDLHAQSSNLGIAEKLLNADLGQTEWLGEVDLERLLIKLGVKDRTHITRLNAEDIGMILHFERVKHLGAIEEYTIPLLINCGNTSLGGQGSHWTYAMVSVNPITNSITINYQDSMPLQGTEQAILTAAINYSDAPYSAFPDFTTKTANVASDGLQEDGWSCGYRALKGLLGEEEFPVHGDVNTSIEWLRLAGTPTRSYSLRNVIYELLLSDLEIDQDYFIAMSLDEKMLKHTDRETYELDSEFTKHYLEFITNTNKTKPVITSEKFTKEYRDITEQLSGRISSKHIDTERKNSLKRLSQKIDEVTSNGLLTADAKILALLDVFTNEYALILKTSGGSNSGLGKFIKKVCLEHFGVELSKDQRYRLKSDGLMMRIFNAQLEETIKKTEEISLLPPSKKNSIVSDHISQSAPVVGTKKLMISSVSPSLGMLRSEDTESVQPRLLKNRELTRLGSMFGKSQFCYAEKPGGVEPGFRSIDCDGAFFDELDIILLDEKLLSDERLPFDQKKKFNDLTKALAGKNVTRKQMIFATFVNTHVKGPHSKEAIDPGIQWLCNEIKRAVAKNNQLSAWMYKLDYAEGQKDRIKTNKEALREFVGTRLAGIFSEKNQKQEIVWVSNSKNGVHALLACGWKNGLSELKKFLHGGTEPDYNGILVEEMDAPVKHSKRVPGLGKNLIFGIAIGDRDGIGKEAQNKGFADGAFYGFDYGKPYEGEGVCLSLKDDFTFEDTYANAPSIFRGSSIFGFARHFMYRNYSIFYDTPLSERMVGVHLLKKMITGENPSEEVMKSYPGLTQELFRIQERTPSPQELLHQLGDIREICRDGGRLQASIDTYITQISTGKLTPFDFYFAKIKIDLIQEAIERNTREEEVEQYTTFIDEMAATADKSNQTILDVFEQRMLLTRQEVDLIDALEKFFSPVSVMSHDRTVFLNTMRFDPPSGRIPFQLIREQNGTYTLSTIDKTMVKQLKNELDLDFIETSEGLSCTIEAKNITRLMRNAELKYNNKRDELLIKPIYAIETFPNFISLVHKDHAPESPKADLGFLWHPDNSLSLQLIAKTEKQVEQLHELLDTPIKINEVKSIEIPPDMHTAFQKRIAEIYHNQNKTKRSIEKEPELESGITLNLKQTKWEKIYQKSERDELEAPMAPLNQLAEQLIKRFVELIGEDSVSGKIKDAIQEISSIDVLEKLMSYKDKTLVLPDTIQAIIEERVEDIKEVEDEMVVTPSGDGGIHPNLL
ncbi:hypothetical protein TUM19329_17410 [Legionella antarctica]|uniref:Uncharacterized protein n=1 Tax=Legionella antarctica TaxID=2708020 RepID=A0A6F8T5F3_9GAMM|nr:hypothetical protein [Legionella antarctica]BCA95380.1 hypothetical protein TUM19329_17410 [Legionella antarctica]